MPKVVYVSFDGEQTTIDVAVNNNLMLAAVYENVVGIEGMCGGCLACASCHVYVDDAWMAKLVPLGEDEDTMLTQVSSARKPNSRLSCQIIMNEQLDGLTVHMPAVQ
jgi:ferredoxin, 2Fe-2S